MKLAGATIEEKLLLNSVRDGGCLRWTRSHNPEGYGQVSVAGIWRLVHRVAYELWVGPIPEDLTIDHVLARGCVHRDCLEPTHLEAVTNAENVRRKPTQPTPTHCKNGHEWTAENTFDYRSHDGVIRQRCIVCQRLHRNAHANKKRRAEGKPTRPEVTPDLPTTERQS